MYGCFSLCWALSGAGRTEQGSPGQLHRARMLSSAALMSRGESEAAQCCPKTTNICSSLACFLLCTRWLGLSSCSGPHYSLCSPWTGSSGIPWELVRNTEPQAPHQRHCTRTCMLTRCPGCPRAQGSCEALRRWSVLLEGRQLMRGEAGLKVRSLMLNSTLLDPIVFPSSCVTQTTVKPLWGE